MKKYIILFLVLLTMVPTWAQVIRSNAFHSKYKLQEVVVFSRHNVRSPMCGPESFLGRITPHSWREWGTGTSELTLRGGILETINGQFFRQWLEKEELLQHNMSAISNNIRFFSNSNQRTIATAKYFSAGLLPTANVNINFDYAVGGMDPLFMLELHGVDDTFIKKAEQQLADLFGKDGLKKFSQSMQPNFNLLAKVIDFKESKAYKSGEIKSYNDHNVTVTFKNGTQPQIGGTMGWAGEVADALVLQYYEEPDAFKAAFGHELTEDQWKEIGKIKWAYDEVRFAIPCISGPMAKPLLAVISKELQNPTRQFSFICGHDINITTILMALKVKDYTRHNSVETLSPIGSKIVFEKWTDAQGKSFIAVNHVYMTTQQLRNIQSLTLQNPPMIIPLQFDGINANDDGLYPFSEFIRKMTTTE